jgi:putative membrane protein
MSLEIHGGLNSWSLPIPVTAALIVVALVYLRGWYRFRHDFPNVLPPWRLGAFLGGLLSLWAAVGSPLALLDHQLLTFHMVQHLLLMTVAAPLILLGAPVITLWYALPHHVFPGVLKALLRCPPVHRIGRILSNPAFCWLSSTAAVIGWHVPALFALGMRPDGWHAIEHVSFLMAGLLFWWPVVQPWPGVRDWSRWGIPLYLFLAALPCDALSAFLTFCNRVVYPHYLSTHYLFDMSPLGDQECAGALMWVWVTLVYLAPAAVVTIQMLSPFRRTSKLEVV